MSVVICEKKRIEARVKDKIYKMVLRPVIMYGMETVPLTKRQKGQAGGGRAEESKIGSDHDGQD